MNQKKISLIAKIISLTLSVTIIISGLALIFGCLYIYFGGDHSYTRQGVIDVFKMISPPVYICLALVIISTVFNVVFSDLSTSHKPLVDLKTKLLLISSKKDIASDNVNYTDILKERKKRRFLNISAGILNTLACLIFLIYALNGNNFDSADINTSVIKAMFVLIPCLCIIVICLIINHIISSKSIKREIELISALPAKKSDSTHHPTTNKNIILTVIKCSVLILGISALLYGLLNGGVADVLTKAVNICTECIGLG